MTYLPCLGEHPTGICEDCGAPATTEIQVGWHNGQTASDSGGQQCELCEACYDLTPEARRYRAEAAIRAAAESLGIIGYVGLGIGYGRHSRADEVLAALPAEVRESLTR